jgi:hypothetical protein
MGQIYSRATRVVALLGGVDGVNDASAMILLLTPILKAESSNFEELFHFIGTIAAKIPLSWWTGIAIALINPYFSCVKILQ